MALRRPVTASERILDPARQYPSGSTGNGCMGFVWRSVTFDQSVSQNWENGEGQRKRLSRDSLRLRPPLERFKVEVCNVNGWICQSLDRLEQSRSVNLCVS